MYKRILVPLDGSGRAERALPIAARIARSGGGSLHLLRVLDTMPASVPSAPAKPLLVQTIDQASYAFAESYLAGVASSDQLAGIAVQTEVMTGLVSASITAHARDIAADLIVICSHGSTGVKSWWLLGSVAEKVAPFSEVPVFVLREGGPIPEERHPGERPLRVLVPLDGSDPAGAALGPAASLAAALAVPGQGALHLLHVVQHAYGSKTLAKATRTEQKHQADRNMANDFLHAVIHRMQEGAADPSVRALALQLTSSVVVSEDVAHAIIDVAENGGDGEGIELFGGCDALAMTTYGYSGPQRWVGSVTQRVLHISRLPLLIVQPRQ